MRCPQEDTAARTNVYCTAPFVQRLMFNVFCTEPVALAYVPRPLILPAGGRGARELRLIALFILIGGAVPLAANAQGTVASSTTGMPAPKQLMVATAGPVRPWAALPEASCAGSTTITAPS